MTQLGIQRAILTITYIRQHCQSLCDVGSATTRGKDDDARSVKPFRLLWLPSKWASCPTLRFVAPLDAHFWVKNKTFISFEIFFIISDWEKNPLCVFFREPHLDRKFSTLFSLFFASLGLTIFIKYIFSACIENNLDYWQRKDTHCGYAPVRERACRSMAVNGRNPFTNPHLSSWITDIINRRDSSISPVFPIQRWGAGLFPSLSADLMTFTELPFVCLEAFYIFIYFHVLIAEQPSLYAPCMLLDSVFLCPSEIVYQFALVWPRAWHFSSFCLSCSCPCWQQCSPSATHRVAVQRFQTCGGGTWNKSVDKSGKAEHMKKRYGLNYV